MPPVPRRPVQPAELPDALLLRRLGFPHLQLRARYKADGSSSVQSGRPESSGVPSYTAQASAPPRKTEKKKHGYIWVLIVLAIIIFAYPRIKVNKKEPEPLQPEVTQPVIEQVVFPESRTEPMTVILRSAYYSHINRSPLKKEI